jgi:hypothetical protein
MFRSMKKLYAQGKRNFAESQGISREVLTYVTKYQERYGTISRIYLSSGQSFEARFDVEHHKTDFSDPSVRVWDDTVTLYSPDNLRWYFVPLKHIVAVEIDRSTLRST